jgi:phosphoglucomutase
MTDYRSKALRWTRPPFDAAIRETVAAWLEGDETNLREAFTNDIAFGTGGLRGVTGPGTARINAYTVGRATQALANYVKNCFPGEEWRVALAYDSRLQSADLANDVTRVLTANGIRVMRFMDVRPTPELSFAIRHHQCHSGIVITASHNPPEYNGYKVYWQDGGQLVPPHDQAIMALVKELDFADIQTQGNPELVTPLGEETDTAFLQAGLAWSSNPKEPQSLRIVYSPLHGTTGTIFPRAFPLWGFNDVHPVAAQMKPDGHFPTVQSPNPEEPEALRMALEQAKHLAADLVLATDPDGDRVGIAAREADGSYRLFNGNEFAVLLTDYLLERLQHSGTLPAHPLMARTIVTTPLLDALAKEYGIALHTCLTGFKWIADIIRREENHLQFVCGGEESYGFMVGSFVRDKDAITAALVVAEAAAEAKRQGMTLLERLQRIHLRHGVYEEKLISLTFKGLEGLERIQSMMHQWRSQAPQTVVGERIVEWHDYLAGTIQTPHGTQSTGLPQSDVIQWVTEGGMRITARPSGTEPKIKFYLSAHAPISSLKLWNETSLQLRDRLRKAAAELDLQSLPAL